MEKAIAIVALVFDKVDNWFPSLATLFADILDFLTRLSPLT
jgi:hypothetical protein